MLYVYLSAAILVIMLFIFTLSRDKSDDEQNLMEDVPTISVNREGLERHALEISSHYSTTRSTNCRKKLMKSLDRSYSQILKAYEYIDKDVANKREIVPAAEWMLDNLYLVEREYKDIKHNMPSSYYRGLPVIDKGIMKGYPRIYHIAVEIVSHTDGRIDEKTIELFIKAYQRNTVLTSGELWALPIMIRIALIQNISKIADKIIFSQSEKRKADIAAEAIIEILNKDDSQRELAKFASNDAEFSSYFIERFLKILRDNGVDNSRIYKWIDDRLEIQQTSAEKMINSEHQKQAGFQLSIGNCINSIREVGAFNWRESFEKLSYVEQILRDDPSDIYPNMDFESRDYYRHRIEKLAKFMKMSESFVAKKAIECASADKGESGRSYERHVGYYIIDDGIAELKKSLGWKKKLGNGFQNAATGRRVYCYIGTIIIGTLLLSATITAAHYLIAPGLSLWRYGVAFLVVIIPSSEIVTSILNWSINHINTPRFVPKMELKEGIPEECSTVVVIPTLLSNKKRVHDLIEDMEVYYLANKEKNLYFALLGDFKDSSAEEEPEDEKILEAALSDVRKLNAKYSTDGEDIFFFLNRHRLYNPKEKMWLGWERKRGKLMEFNSLLRGNDGTTYNTVSGELSKLKGAKYVITLDADTELPRDTAKKLIGAMYHPLNRAHLSKKIKKVERGYGLMQPRISVSTMAANKTMFSKIFSGETGIDLYTTAVSDVYQDLFGEGIFTGKGIYDIDVFEYMLKEEIPENTVLSHDLLEGSYARCALVTDIELIDGYPAYYNSSSMRLHRWVRGDWQIISWIFKKSSLSKLSRWKIFDNLRRSLLAPAIILLIILSFIVLPDSDEWLTVAVLAILCPILFDVSEAVVSPVKGISLSGKIDNGKTVVEQVFLIFTFLPYQAYLMVDAIVRTLYRVTISRRKLLEWQTAADVESKLGRKLQNFIASMWMGSLIAVVIALLAFSSSFSEGILILPSCVVWFLGPLIAYFISLNRNRAFMDLRQEEKYILRRLSRKTWAYFEDFVSEKNNYLAPDNYQEDPSNGVAPRTSPTNMGMGITSNIAAFDLGYINILYLLERLEKIISNMESLKRYKGHFYNWYDTNTKEPLHPRYVSTVDSGNLVGYLWMTEEALEEYLRLPFINDYLAAGLTDTLLLSDEEIERKLKIKGYYSTIINDLKKGITSLKEWIETLKNIDDKLSELEGTKAEGEFYWNDSLKNTLEKHLEGIRILFPWAEQIYNSSGEESEFASLLMKIPVSSSILSLNEDIGKIIPTCSRNSKDNRKLTEDSEGESSILNMLKHTINESQNIVSRVRSLQERLGKMSDETDFAMLYDNRRQLFAIGYDIEKDSLGNSYYDLLASESRQASFVAIAKGDVEQKHWFKLGRSMTIMGNSKGLVSWSGTMFEYFMPLLIMRNYPDTLLNETYKSVIEGQKMYCRDRKVPWGISESAFYTFDVALNYQYKAFGVPGIGLKRGLVNELVISPYSTVLALQIDLPGALNNIQRLIKEELEGRYGFYEAVDYTKERMPKGKKRAVVKCFMVHHEGMSLMALDNVLRNNILQDRFHRIPKVKATELLLQERVPRRIVYDRNQKFEVVNLQVEKQNIIVREYKTAKTETPVVHLLSNGSYSMMVSNSGSGYSKVNDMTVYRFREDSTLDNTGMFFYIKNLNSNDYWSAAYEPCKDEGEDYKVTFSLDKVEFKRKDGNIITHTEIAVSNEDNAEVRRMSITNHSDHTRTIEVTSYLEVTLAPYNADIVHPSFSNLFIKTEYLDNPSCIIANRRPRAKGQKKPYLMQTAVVEGETIGTIQYETNRANFIGRGRDVSNPQVMENDAPLKNTVGAVLDPIISIRRRVKIKPGQTCKIAYTTAVADSREEIIELARKYREFQNIDRIFELAWTQSQVEMRYLGIKSAQANLYQLMASKIIFINTLLKEREEYIKNIKKSQPALWPYGISGDLPIMVALVRKDKDIDLVRQILNAHEYWGIKGLKVDLVIINLQNTVYIQSLQDSVRDLITSSHARDKQNKPGGVFLHNRATMPEEDIDLLIAIARLVIDSDKGALINQIKEAEKDASEMELLPVKGDKYEYKPYRYPERELIYFNGIGGFDAEGSRYVIRLRDKDNTPAPWINVMSNGDFGFHISESGSAYTWYKNSRENKLTSWSNDPVTDPATEALYIRDEITGNFWSISPKPVRDNEEYIIEHGFGYSVFKHAVYGIAGEFTTFAAMDENVKLCIIKLKNVSERERELSASYYAQLVLGVIPQQSAQYISTYINENKNFIYAQNPYSEHFGRAYTFLKLIGGVEEAFTGDRKEFIGRGESLKNPKALRSRTLSNTAGAGLDPCLAAFSRLKIMPGEEKTFVVLLGANEDIDSIERIVEKYEEAGAAEIKLQETKDYWNRLLGTIKVKTPDKTMDILLNGWLMYQTISCRYWARTAFYQSGGAIGYRDQLQDVMSINFLNPEFTRKQILTSASRQYLEGDVQHWWHPVVDSGIRTRFSDDLLWLPFVTIDYIKNSGDYSILDETAEYLEDEPLKEGEDERYKIVGHSNEAGSIYEHCIKAIDCSLRFGPHNIPLMGSGDWNDGMSTVGNKGRGESVWLGWFLYSILDGFIEICRNRGDFDRVQKYQEFRGFIKDGLEENAWDGGWYRRAYFDDGTPLGSIENDECQIDSLAQSWSVISGAARESRAKAAMEALERYLVKEDKGMVLLLTPAFNKSELEPGYIKGYVPGVRENGGQYTHAATWVILAFTKLGMGSRAWKIFNMINPINHTRSFLDLERYKVEPYVMAADVYAREPHEGRGGWTWYTGTSGWMYKVGIEGILGLRLINGKGFKMEPCIPDEWHEYEMEYRREKCIYKIKVTRGAQKGTTIDGTTAVNGIVPFMSEGEHIIEVTI